MNLTGLGLSADQDLLYRFLLRNPGDMPIDPAIRAPESALDELVQLGLVGADRVPLPPSAAIDLLIRRRIDHTTRDLQQLSSAWELVQELSVGGHPGRAVEVAERIEGTEAINRRIHASPAREEVLNMKLTPISRPVHSDRRIQTYRRQLAAGLASRTIVSAESVTEPEQREYAWAQHQLGDLHRVAVHPFRRMLVVDRKTAYVLAEPDNVTTALLIRQPGPIATLVELFEFCWQHARPLDGTPLSRVERQVLHAMSIHATDDVAARSIPISVRKYRGHIAELMTRVNAVSRFQLALRAKDNGWL